MQARFSLQGELLAPDVDLPTHLGLHHHGEEAEVRHGAQGGLGSLYQLYGEGTLVRCLGPPVCPIPVHGLANLFRFLGSKSFFSFPHFLVTCQNLTVLSHLPLTLPR